MREPAFDLGRLDHLEEKLGAPKVAEILGEFLGHVPDKILLSWKAETEDDLVPAAAALHSIRSSAGLLGATHLATLAGEMEGLARNGDLDAYRALCDDLKAVFAATEVFCHQQRRRLAP